MTLTRSMHVNTYLQEVPSYETAEKFLSKWEVAMESALEKMLVTLKVKRVEDLLA